MRKKKWSTDISLGLSKLVYAYPKYTSVLCILTSNL